MEGDLDLFTFFPVRNDVERNLVLCENQNVPRAIKQMITHAFRAISRVSPILVLALKKKYDKMLDSFELI